MVRKKKQRQKRRRTGPRGYRKKGKKRRRENKERMKKKEQEKMRGYCVILSGFLERNACYLKERVYRTAAPNGKAELCSEKLWNRPAPGLSLSLMVFFFYFPSSLFSSPFPFFVCFIFNRRVLSLLRLLLQTPSNGIYLADSVFRNTDRLYTSKHFFLLLLCFQPPWAGERIKRLDRRNAECTAFLRSRSLALSRCGAHVEEAASCILDKKTKTKKLRK